MSNYGHQYPPHQQYGDDQYGSGGLASPGPQSAGYPEGAAPSPYYAASSGSLPRYSSGGGPNTPYSPGGKDSGLSPLNPSASRPQYLSGASSRYSGVGGGSHPLSNAMYADSSPTLGGGQYEPVGGDEKHSAQSHHLPAGASPSLGGGGGSAEGGQSTGYQRRPGGRGEIAPAGGIAGGRQNRSALENTYRRMSGAAWADSGKDPRHTKYSANAPHRLGYLDGLKFIAAWIVVNGTMFDAVLSDNDYTGIQRGSPLYIFRSTNLGIVFFLLFEGRCLIHPLWDIPPPNATVQPANSEKPPQPARPSISWPRLTRAMLVRPFRFIFPVATVAALQWGVRAAGNTSNCHAVGMDEPYWDMITNFAGYCTLVWNLFTYYEWDTLAGQTFAGNLWTNPWFYQASYAAYVVHLMMGNLSSNRYWVYGILAFFSWTTYNFFYVAILGVFIADLAAHGHLARIRKMPIISRAAIQVCLVAIACVTQFIGPIRDNLNSGLAKINVQDHQEVSFCDSIFAVCVLLIVETSSILQAVFGNVVMRTLGRLAAGMYLLSAPLLYTIVPDLALSLHTGGSSPSSILGVTWLVLFGASVGLAIPFHFLIELPSRLVGEYFANFVETWGVDDAQKRAVRRTLIRPRPEKKGAPASRQL